MPFWQAARCFLLALRQVSQRKIMVSRASSSSEQMSSASISPLGCNIWSEMSRIACKVAAELRLGFGFSSGLSASLACRSCRTRAGRSSGGALAMAATAFSVGLMLPERISCLIPGSASSAASTPLAKCSALRTYFSFRLFSRAIRLAVHSPFWCWTFWSC